jgi:hypothetical protein
VTDWTNRTNENEQEEEEERMMMDDEVLAEMFGDDSDGSGDSSKGRAVRAEYPAGLRGFHQLARDHATWTLTEFGSVPRFVLAEKNGCIGRFWYPADNDHDANWALFDLQAKLEAHGVDYAAKIGEAWASIWPTGSTPPTMKPSQNPDRRSMVVIVSRARDGSGLRSEGVINEDRTLGPWEGGSWDDSYSIEPSPYLLGMTPPDKMQ